MAFRLRAEGPARAPASLSRLVVAPFPWPEGAPGPVLMAAGRVGGWKPTLAVAILVASYLVVVLLTTQGIEIIPPDALSYLIVARSLLEGNGYTVDYVDVHVAVFDPLRHTPEMHGLLQPFAFAGLLATLGDHPSLVRIPGYFYTAGAGLAAFALARQAFGSLAALAACLLVLTNLRLLSVATLGADDVGFAFLFLCMLAALHRALVTRRERDFVVAGLWAGAASLMKPIGLFQPLVFGALALLWRPLGAAAVGRRALAIGLPFVVLSSFYTLRNLAAHGGLGGRVSPLNLFQKTLGVEAVYRVYDAPPTLLGALREVGPMPLFESALRQLAQFARNDLTSALTSWPSSPLDFASWFSGALALTSIAACMRLARRHQEIATLYVCAAVGSVLFVCILWHYEPRYLSLLIPLEAVLVAGLLAPAERASGHTGKLMAGLAATLVVLSLLGFAAFTRQAPGLTRFLNERSRDASCRDAYDWIRNETDARDRVLTFNPWDLTWFAQRESIILPSGGLAAITEVSKRYDAGWLMLQPTPGRAPTRAAVHQLLAGRADVTAELAYERGTCRVHRLHETESRGREPAP